MSHVASVVIEINDLEAMEAACKRAGWTFKRNQTSYKWYGRWVNDYSAADAAYRNGIDPKNYGKCSHAISVPGTERGYEVGLVEKEKGKFVAVFDFFDRGLMKALGGQNAPKLLQMYGVEKTRRECVKRGYKVTEKIHPDGTIKLQIAGRF